MTAALSLLTYSRLSAFRVCPRKHHNAYTLGVRPLHVAAPLRVGTCGHEAVGAGLLARQQGADPEARWQAARGVLIGPLGAALDPYDRVELAVLVRSHLASWDALDVEVLAVEREFQLPLLNPETGAASRTFRLAGKMDAIVRWAGRVLVVEHKFTTENPAAGTTYARRLAIDAQVDQYFRGAESLGYAVEGVVYDVVKRPRLKVRRATDPDKLVWIKDRKTKQPIRLRKGQWLHDETPAEYHVRLSKAVLASPGTYLHRHEVVRTEAQRDEYAFDVWQLGRSIADAERLGRAPRNTEACHRYYGTCAYWHVCLGEASLDDPSRFRRAASVHEELDAGGDAGKDAG